MTWFLLWLVLATIAAGLQGWTEGVRPTCDAAEFLGILLISVALPFLAIPFFAACLAKHYARW